MAQRLEDLVVRISGDTASLNRAVGQASRQVDGFSRNASRSFSNLGRAITAAAGALAAFGVATQLRAATQSALQLGGTLTDTADRLGTTVVALQRLREAAEPAGISAGKLDTSLLRLSKNLGEAQAGTGELASALRGTQDELLASLLSADTASDAFLLLADGIAKIPDPLEQARIATAAFGRSGVELLNVLKLGGAGLAGLGDEAERSGRILSEEAAVALDEFGDRLEQLAKTALVQFAEGLSEAAFEGRTLTDVLSDPNTIEAIGDMSRGIADLTASLAGLAARAIDAVRGLREFLDVGSGPLDFLRGDQPTSAFRNPESFVGDRAAQARSLGFDEFGNPLPSRSSGFSRGRAPLRRSARAGSGGARSRASGGAGPEIQLDTSNLLRGELAAYEEANAKAFEAFDEMVKASSESVDDALRTIEERAETFGDLMGSIVGNFVNGAEMDWKRLAQSFIAALVEMQVKAAAMEIFKTGSRAIAGATGGGAGGGFGNILGSILGAFGFAEGGIVTKPTLALIGEGQEAEGVLPLSQLRNFVGNSAPTVNIINRGQPLDVESTTRRRTGTGDEIDVVVAQSFKRGNARGEFRQQLNQRHAPGVG